MHVERLDENRDWYTLHYDKEKCDGETVTVEFTNPADGDKSNAGPTLNDGEVLCSVGAGHTGTDDVVVTGSDGGEDTDRVTFGAAKSEV
jgi:hypothetical protein